jgi:hypothetical protein
VPATTEAPKAAWDQTDWKASGLLVVLPTLLLSLAAVAGYPLITGDDVAQNFPLEYLVGQEIRHGHLPLYDSFLWSGTPLLGGTVAHALLPITLLFAVLPPLPAWVVGEVLVLGAATVGCQLFLRRTGCGSLSSALAGASYGLAGFVSSQIVHSDFAAAAAALPWLLVGIDGLATRPAPARGRHCVLIATAIAWICLCGSPDIVIDTVVVCGAYTGHLLLQPLTGGRRAVSRARLCIWELGGAAGGLAVGALQWAPSAYFVAASQRSHPSLAFISAGSLSWANFLELLVPHVLGGGSLGARAYGGTYPLAEVDAYPGVLALVAIFALLSSWRAAGAWRWRVWILVAALALLLASGGHTPLERLLAALPILGDQRLPSRALVSFALAASLLGGYFFDSLLVSHPTPRQIAAGSLPIVSILGIVIATLTTGKPAGGALVAHAPSGWTLGGDIAYLLAAACLALTTAAFLLFGKALQGRRRVLVVTALVVVDLVSFDLNQSSLAPEYAYALQVTDHSAVSALAGSGRYLVIDPGLSDGLALDRVGAPDLGVIAGLSDAAGYGSLAWGPYANATGTHTQDGAAPAALANGTFSGLGVRALLTVRSELVVGSSHISTDTQVSEKTPVVRWFGTPVSVRSITVEIAGAASAATVAQLSSSLRLLGGADRVERVRMVTSSRVSRETTTTTKVTIKCLGSESSFGLELGGRLLRGAISISEPSIRPSTGSAFFTSGPLAAALGGGKWTETTGTAGFSVLVDRAAAALLRVSAKHATVRLVSSDPWTGSAVVQVQSPAPTVLVRSVADIPGWRARLTHGGRQSFLAVRRDGLVQSVSLPSGTSRVTFRYVPPGWVTGQLLALLGALACAGLLFAPAVMGRRWRRPLQADSRRLPIS